MGLEKKTPLVFVLPNKFFHVEKGISIAELEFPIYFNFFFRGGKKTFIVCSPEQKEQLTIVLGESLMGPQELNLSSEFIDGAESFGFPDIKAEMAYFRSYKSMEEVVEFVLFDDSHKAKFGGITIEQLPSNEFLVVDGEKNQNPW